ncbi:MAG: type II toxin-antitoxin system mRNA interferase toxin, RelE/StbE family, partial [Succinivibrio dextrinosolvens]|nr:type II toxin-antitoxin system mRNA interferase toxin, RelE/StbE family [Succinivibrio dextrinosolvens]
TKQFKKDYKLAMKRNLNIELLDDIIRKIANDIPLSETNRDHSLNGNWFLRDPSIIFRKK